MIEVEYTKDFLKSYKKIKIKNPNLASEIREKILEFQDESNHRKLRVHKLKRPFENVYSFSVNYRIRITFEYLNKKTAALLLTVGDHDIYNK